MRGGLGRHALCVLILGAWLSSVAGAEERTAASSEQAPAGAASAMPHRQPDGTVFVSKPTQRLLGIRTVTAETVSGRPSIELMGRVLMDPNASASVRAPRNGTIEPAEKGIPHIGQRVGRGDTLAWLLALLAPAEETQLRQKLVEVEREQALLVPRAEHAGVVNPNMPMGEAAVALLQEIQIQAQALSKQAELIKAALAPRLEIKAPIEGTIASTTVRAGELVTAGDALVEIVDPARARVEAYAFGPLPRDVEAATAATDDGRKVDLAYLGQGPVLRGQAVPLLFQVKPDEAAALEFGSTVRVHVKEGRVRQGIKLPRNAVQRSGAAYVVFEHTRAELFVPRSVSVEHFDAEHVLVNGDVAVGARVVSTGAVFIAQVR